MAVRRGRNTAFIISKITTFTLAVGIFGLYIAGVIGGWLWIAPVVLLLLYIQIKRFDSKNDSAINTLEDVLATCQKETDYLQGKFDAFDDGQRYADAKHPFTLDLDIFGQSGLYQRVCRTATTDGGDRLASALKLADGPHDERHGAIAELSRAPELLTDFKRWGQRGVADTTAVSCAFDRMNSLHLPSWFCSEAVKIFYYFYWVVFCVALVHCVHHQQHVLGMFWWCIFNFFAIYIM